MATAVEARQWARDALRGIGNSLYTPFSGPDGDDIDWDAYRTLVRYCVGDLRHPMLWCTSGIAEFWSLTLDERKLLAGGGDRGRRARSTRRRGAGLHRGDVGEGLPRAHAARAAGRCRHRLHPDADDGGPRRRGRAAVLPLHRRPHRHRAGDVQLAVLRIRPHARESARIYDEIPAVCATKEGAFRPAASRLLHQLAPDLTIWECDKTVYRAGWLRDGIVVRRAAGHRRVSVRDAERPIVFDVLGPDRRAASSSTRWTTPASRGWISSTSTWARGSPAIRAVPTTSPTGAGPSSSRRRCWVCRSATIRTRDHRKRSFPSWRRTRFEPPTSASDWSTDEVPGSRLRKALPIGVQYEHLSS